MTTFLAMGGYARWVWSAFGFTTLVLLANVWTARRAFRRALREVRAWRQEQPGRNAA